MWETVSFCLSFFNLSVSLSVRLSVCLPACLLCLSEENCCHLEFTSLTHLTSHISLHSIAISSITLFDIFSSPVTNWIVCRQLLEYRLQRGGIQCSKLLGHMNIDQRDAVSFFIIFKCYCSVVHIFKRSGRNRGEVWSWRCWE